MRTPRRRPGFLLLAIVAASLAALTAPAVSETAAGDCTPGGDWPAARPDLPAAVLTLVNAQRAAVGAPALVASPTLTAAATWKARHMAMYHYMTHDDPGPPVSRTPADRLAACGYAGGWGENIAYGFPTASGVVSAWLASPGHRANIEQPAYRSTGISAAVASNGVVYWAQEFGTATEDTAPPSSPPKLPPPPPPADPPPPTTTTTTPTPTQAAHLRLAPAAAGTPRAAHRFALLFRVDGVATGTTLTVTCRVRIGARAVRVAARFENGYARCELAVPRGSRGRQLSGTVEVTAATEKARRSFSRVVR